MTQVELDNKLIAAIGFDTGNTSMRKAGRSAWNEEDWNAACEIADRLRERLRS